MSASMDDAPVEATTAASIDFLRAIDVKVQYAELGEPCFLPAIEICNGALRIDHARRCRPAWPMVWPMPSGSAPRPTRGGSAGCMSSRRQRSRKAA